MIWLADVEKRAFVSYDLPVLPDQGEHTSAFRAGLPWRKLVELFKKKDSRFYWHDFESRGKRYRRSTKETNKKRAVTIAALRLSQAMGGTGLWDGKAPRMQEFSIRFLIWVESAALADKSAMAGACFLFLRTSSCIAADTITALLRSNTGNLAAVMKTMGHEDVRAAMQYQHPNLNSCVRL